MESDYWYPATVKDFVGEGDERRLIVAWHDWPKKKHSRQGKAAQPQGRRVRTEPERPPPPTRPSVHTALHDAQHYAHAILTARALARA